MIRSLILEKLTNKFPDYNIEDHSYRNEDTIIVKPEKISHICSFLKNDTELLFDLLSDLCGADYYPKEPRFEVIYNLYSIVNNYRLRIKSQLSGDNPKIDSVSNIWVTANWHERETFDMFGIIFIGHPNLKRIYMTEDYKYFPLRKDFPLMGWD